MSIKQGVSNEVRTLFYDDVCISDCLLFRNRLRTDAETYNGHGGYGNRTRNTGDTDGTGDTA